MSDQASPSTAVLLRCGQSTEFFLHLPQVSIRLAQLATDLRELSEILLIEGERGLELISRAFGELVSLPTGRSLCCFALLQGLELGLERGEFLLAFVLMRLHERGNPLMLLLQRAALQPGRLDLRLQFGTSATRVLVLLGLRWLYRCHAAGSLRTLFDDSTRHRRAVAALGANRIAAGTSQQNKQDRGAMTLLAHC